MMLKDMEHQTQNSQAQYFNDSKSKLLQRKGRRLMFSPTFGEAEQDKVAAVICFYEALHQTITDDTRHHRAQHDTITHDTGRCVSHFFR